MLGLDKIRENINYLDKERKLLWKTVTELEKLVEENASTHEKEAKQASRETAKYRNRAEERGKEIQGFYSEASSTLENIKSKLAEAENIGSSIKANQSVIIEAVSEVNERATLLETKIKNIDEILEEHPDLSTEVETLSSQLSDSEENSTKISTLLTNVIERKKTIDGVFFEINGYNQDNEETGETERVEGLKDKLVNQFTDIKKDFNELQSDFDKLFEDKSTETDNAINLWSDKYKSIVDRIESLLPNALTAGLSSAYHAKKKDELKNYENLKWQFNLGIIFMVLISLISVGISVKLISEGMEFIDMLNILPKIVVAIIPICIPILWFTIFANKKLNLSKRLIEEYTHKEVIGKTFEGLSTQIENLDNDEVSKELRLKLLFNILETSTENPGKLISDYKRIDHPLVEVLSQQSKMEEHWSKIKDLPGFGKFSEYINKKAAKRIAEKEKELDELIEKANNVI